MIRKRYACTHSYKPPQHQFQSRLADLAYTPTLRWALDTMSSPGHDVACQHKDASPTSAPTLESGTQTRGPGGAPVMDIFFIRCVASSRIPVSTLVAGTTAQASAANRPVGESTCITRCKSVLESRLLRAQSCYDDQRCSPLNLKLNKPRESVQTVCSV